jgi:predicted phage-related endonuclease
MAAILGFDPRRNASDVWLEKTGKLADDGRNLRDHDPLLAGTFFEDGVLQYAEREFGEIIRNQYRVAKGLPFPMGSNVDALVRATGQPIEAKTTGLFFFSGERWGDTDSDVVPERVLIQSLVHMICTSFDTCRVAAFIGGRGFARFLVPWDKQVVDIMCERADEFWNKHVVPDIPPTNMQPHLEILKRVRREPNRTVPIANALVMDWLEKKAAKKIAEEKAEAAQAAMITAMADAEAAVCDLGTVTFLEQNRSGIDRKRLAIDHPGILADYVEISTCRVTRFKKVSEKASRQAA